MTIFMHCSKILDVLDVLLEQIIIDKYTVGILNNIDIYENIVTFVHILSSFNEKISLIAKINIAIFMV